MNQAMTESKNYSLDRTSESFKYWQQQLVGSPPLLELPIDRPRQSSRNYRYEVQNITLSRNLLASLKVLVADARSDLLITLLAAFKVLLYRYTDRQDIMIGTPIVSRDLATIEGLSESAANWLIAYIVPHQHQPTIDSLREFLAQKLPEYAIPAVFVLLDTFPLTPNGKVDRSALPAPEALRTKSTAAPIAPLDELEQELTQIWARLLGIESIGIGKNFFELGGNSLMAVRLFTEIVDRRQRNLPLSTLLKNPTIAELANLLRAAPGAMLGLN
jgi:non-ribosomal peptide synthetase component F